MTLGMDTVKVMIELTLARYDAPEIQELSEQYHFDHVAPCYGEPIPGKSLEEQLADSGAIIAILYWKLAQARGLVPVEESA